VLGADRHPVHPQGVDDDPQDREEAEHGSLGGAGERLVQRHAVREAGDQSGRQQAGEGCHVRFDADAAEQDEDDHQREGRDQGGQPSEPATGSSSWTYTGASPIRHVRFRPGLAPVVPGSGPA
jgi:hypothetical protein